MDYKSFIIEYKLKNGKNPNQLEIEKLYEEYIKTNTIKKSLSLNDYIQNCDLINIKKLIEINTPYTTDTIHLAIKTNNYEIFKCVYNYVKKISTNDYDFAKTITNINPEIMKIIDDYMLSLFSNISITPKKYILNNKLINSINGKTASRGGLNIKDLKNEAYLIFHDEKIFSMKRDELISYIKTQSKLI
jgi:hypothetical protein